MFNRKIKGFAAIGAAIAALLVVSALPAQAATATTGIPVSASDAAHYESVWSTYGVPAATQAALLSKLRSGGVWDSLSGGAPKSTESLGQGTTIERFADGSIIVQGVGASLATSSGGITPNADISSCTTLEQSAYDNTLRCGVETNEVIAYIVYSVTFHRVSRGYGSITDAGYVSANCYGGTCTGAGKAPRYIQAKETSGAAAAVEADLTYYCYAGLCSRSLWLRFQLKNNVYSVSNN